MTRKIDDIKWDDIEVSDYKDEEKENDEWNIDTICKEGKTKTIINKINPKKGDENEADIVDQIKAFFEIYDLKIKQYGMIRKAEDTERFLKNNPNLVCKNTTEHLVIWCIDLAVEKKELMKYVSHQCIVMYFILELAKSLVRDPRECIKPFFVKFRAQEPEYRLAFNSQLEAFRVLIMERARVRIQEAKTRYEEPPNLEGEFKSDGKILSLKFNSKWILVASDNIQIFDVASLEKPVISIKDSVVAVDWISLNEETSEGVFVAASTLQRVSIWQCNLETFIATEICELKGLNIDITRLAVSTDLNLVACTNKHGDVMILSTDISEAVVAQDTLNAIPSKDAKMLIINAHSGAIRAIQWLSDSKTTGNLLTCSVDGQIKQWRVNRTSEMVSNVGTLVPSLCLDVNDDNRTILVGSDFGRIQVHSLINYTFNLQEISGLHDGDIKAIKWSPINSYQFVTGGKNGIKLWDLRNMDTPLLELTTNLSSIDILDWSVDGQWLVASCSEIFKLYRFKQ